MHRNEINLLNFKENAALIPALIEEAALKGTAYQDALMEQLKRQQLEEDEKVSK